MLKNILKIIATSVLVVSISNAEPIDLSGSIQGIDVSIKSANSLVVGSNDF